MPGPEISSVALGRDAHPRRVPNRDQHLLSLVERPSAALARPFSIASRIDERVEGLGNELCVALPMT